MKKEYVFIGVLGLALILFFLLIFSNSRKVRNSYNYEVVSKRSEKKAEKVQESLVLSSIPALDSLETIDRKINGALAEIEKLRNQFLVFNSNQSNEQEFFISKTKEMKNLNREVQDLKKQITAIKSRDTLKVRDTSITKSILEMSSRISSLEQSLKSLNEQFLLFVANNSEPRTQPLVPSFQTNSSQDSLILALKKEVDNLSASLKSMSQDQDKGRSKRNSADSKKIEEMSKRMDEIDELVKNVYKNLLIVQDSVFTEMKKLRAGS